MRFVDREKVTHTISSPHKTRYKVSPEKLFPLYKTWDSLWCAFCVCIKELNPYESVSRCIHPKGRARQISNNMMNNVFPMYSVYL